MTAVKIESLHLLPEKGCYNSNSRAGFSQCCAHLHKILGSSAWEVFMDIVGPPQGALEWSQQSMVSLREWRGKNQILSDMEHTERNILITQVLQQTQ